jgi:hypothetical protein
MIEICFLDRCEFCDAELSMQEARRLTAIGLARYFLAKSSVFQLCSLPICLLINTCTSD